MTKAVLLPLGFIFLLAASTPSHSQTSTADVAVNEAVLRQAKTIDLRQKLMSAKAAETRGELLNAAKLYQESAQLAQQIGSGIDLETAQALAGLSRTRLTLARQAESQRDYNEAGKQILQVLNYDPKNLEAQALKKQNDQLIAMSRGTIPDTATLDEIPVVSNQKTDAGTLVQDGKLLYEMGKLDEAHAKLERALKLDPDNVGAFYYLNLIAQAQFSRSSFDHTVDTQDRMQQVEKQWVLPKNQGLGANNPFATTNLVYTGPGRQALVNKLNRIHLENVSYDGLPLSEVIRDLTEKSKSRDPDKVGINFLINPNADATVATTGPGGGGGPGFPGQEGRQTPIDPATGLPLNAPAGNAADQTDVSGATVKLTLSNVSLAEVLDAIVLVANVPIKYSVQDYAIVFAQKSPDQVPLFMRTFKVDANTFFQGLESVNSTSFGAAAQSSSGGGGGGGGSSGGGQSGQTTSAVVPVVDFAPGASQIRQSAGGGGGGGGGQQQQGFGQQQGGGGGGAVGAGGLGGAASGWGGAGGQQGGVNFLTVKRTTGQMNILVRSFFDDMGVNLNPPRSVFFNDRLGLLFVRATESDLDTIERAIEVLNQIAPQVHIKSRFIEVRQTDSKALGFDWYLGQVGNTVALTGGSSPSVNVPVSAANSAGVFPGTSTATAIPSASANQEITSGLNQTGPTIATITGILTNPNFQVAIHALEQRSGVENLAEPEVTTTSGRQTQMRATTLITVVVGENFQSGATGGTGTGTGVVQ